MTAQTTVLCIGVANVDVVAHVDTAFLVRHRIDKGTSTLMRSADIAGMIGALKDAVFIPGGCAANTACGVGMTGVRTVFAGMTGDDDNGKIFKDGFVPYHVIFDTPPNPEKRTSLCVTLVTQDKERSFVFSPDAASWFLGEDHLPVHDSATGPLIVYTEANLFRMTAGTTQQSMVHAVIEQYRHNGARMILNLIDTEITLHQRQSIHTLIDQGKLDYILCNADELMALFDADSAEAAIEAARNTHQSFIATLGRDGAVAIENQSVTRIDPIFVAHEDICDLIGAGDQFAAGFVAGIAQGKTILDACRLGALKASEILVVPGARPRTG